MASILTHFNPDHTAILRPIFLYYPPINTILTSYLLTTETLYSFFCHCSHACHTLPISSFDNISGESLYSNSDHNLDRRTLRSKRLCCFRKINLSRHTCTWSVNCTSNILNVGRIIAEQICTATDKMGLGSSN